MISGVSPEGVSWLRARFCMDSIARSLGLPRIGVRVVSVMQTQEADDVFVVVVRSESCRPALPLGKLEAVLDSEGHLMDLRAAR